MSTIPFPRFGQDYPQPDDAELDPDREDPYDLVRRRLPILDWQALWADDEAEEWILQPLLPARRLVAVYSAPKTGKSLLMLEVAVGVARGTEVLGDTPDRPRRVLYVDYENDPRGDVRERLEAMGFSPADLGNLCYLSFPVMGGLDTPAGASELMAAIEVYACEVVIVDTVSRAVTGEENDNDTWLSLYRHTGLRLKQAGVAMIRLDHTGKDETKGQRGGSAKVGDVDAVWKLERTPGAEESFKLTCEANRMPVVEKTIVMTRMTNPVLYHRVEGAGWRAEEEAAIRAVIAAADAARLPWDAGRPAVTAVVKAAGLKVSKTRLEKAVKRRKSCPQPSGQLPFGTPAPDPPGQPGAARPSLRVSAGQVPNAPAPDPPGQPGAASLGGAAPSAPPLRRGQPPDHDPYEGIPDPVDEDEPNPDEWRSAP